MLTAMPVKLFIKAKFGSVKFFNDQMEPIFLGTRHQKIFASHKWTITTMTGEEVATMKIKAKSGFGSNRVVDFSESNKYPHSLFISSKIWSGFRFEFELKGDSYLIVYNRGNTFSFYRNKIQFGLLRNRILSIGGEATNYVATFDTDTDAIFASILCYVVIAHEESMWSESSDITIDIGYIGPEFIESDDDWIPE